MQTVFTLLRDVERARRHMRRAQFALARVAMNKDDRVLTASLQALYSPTPISTLTRAIVALGYEKQPARTYAKRLIREISRSMAQKA